MKNDIDVKKHLSDGFEMFKANTNTLVVVAIGYIVVSLAANIIPFGGLVVGGPLFGAVYLILMDLDNGEGLDLKRTAEGVLSKLVPLILAGIAISVVIIIGAVFLVIPGILFTGWYLFAYLYIVDRDMDFWPAMEASREIGFSNQVGIFLFALALVGINILGALAFGLGLLVSLPVSACAVYKAYGDVVGMVNDPGATVGKARVMSNKPKMRVEPPPPPPPEEGKGKK